jgi:hypothetical protein
MKSFRHPLLYFLISLLPGLHSSAQDSSSIKLTAASSNAAFPGDSSAWQSYLKRNVDTMVPIRNKAKSGSYTVVVKFIISKSDMVSDVAPVTNYGYGMEEEVMKVMMKWSRWEPAGANTKPGYQAYTVSFTFVVPKKKGLFGRRRN